MSELFHVSIDYLLKDETASKEQSVIPDIFNHGFFKKRNHAFRQKGYRVGYAISLYGLYHLLPGLLACFMLYNMTSDLLAFIGGSFFNLPIFIQFMFIAVSLICLFGIGVIIAGFVIAHKLKKNL